MIPNPHIFFEALDEEVKNAHHAENLFGLVLIDLPVIKRIDLFLGYKAGDEAAREIMAGVAKILKPGDRLYRLDRSILACILTPLNQEGNAWAAAYKILQVVGRRTNAGGYCLHNLAAAGLALFPAHADNSEALLRVAGLALHHAPQTAERVSIYQAQQHEAFQYQFQLQSELGKAIDDNALAIFFQPQLDLRTGELVAAEALSRWEHARLGFIPPSAFIPTAEAAGWMPKFTQWLIHTSLREYQTRSDQLKLSINLSAQDIIERDLPDLIRQSLNTWGIRPDRLCVEVTETTMMETNAVLEKNLTLLKEMGVQLSIDDFGTGYSSFARLKFLPVDEIKIDLSFIRGVTKNKLDAHIVRSIIDLAHKLEISVVAEGVEDDETLQTLRAMGCNLAQGYFISRALPPQQFAQFIGAHDAARWRV